MKLKVESDVVRKNVELFKVLLRKSSQQTTSNKILQGKIYKAFINKLSGELSFCDVSPEISASELSTWRPLSFRVFAPPAESMKCEIVEQNIASSADGVAPEAVKVLQETVKTIQLISRLLPRIQNLPRLFLEFSQVHLEVTGLKKGQYDIVHNSWHQVDRIETEALLGNKEIGTFIFRKDEYARILERELSKAHAEPIKCITLSYLHSTQKICDLTLVLVKQGWLVYNDDPTLDQPVYPDIEVFIDNMKGILVSPLAH